MTTVTDVQVTPALDEDGLWRAVVARDARLTGAFVFGVRSTGVYCRPGCPARQPGREQVVFFASPRDAEQAHFRACKRCRPREGSGFDPQAELVRRICGYIDANLDEPLTLAILSGHVKVSPYHLQRTFKRIVGITPHQYVRARRLSALKSQLREGRGVTTALYEAGYGSSSRLYEEAASGLGMTPATYRRGGRGMRIGYTIVDCALGRLLVGATERGVCAVSLGSADGGLEAALRAEYPAAEIRRDDGGLGEWVNALLRHLNGDQPDLRLPLDVQATSFQRRVWEQLRAIPYGDVRSYGQIARAMGQPAAARAVGRACATNPVAVVIPCHRAVGGNGSLTGYRWGLERKRLLLERERTVTSQSPRSS
ncbi:MAG TPA: bifunctional DNA-binding transcriptional regulator/O6-methylguanine-DNA methyltransferase Ada [Dehalococcoidia bacterium]|nr:bifunctional DNA-binding transcriptional regulator/O6-methylguanine-DNA methyltransferase Ada [Dehalococcoidia bacterium]